MFDKVKLQYMWLSNQHKSAMGHNPQKNRFQLQLQPPQTWWFLDIFPLPRNIFSPLFSWRCRSISQHIFMSENQTCPTFPCVPSASFVPPISVLGNVAWSLWVRVGPLASSSWRETSSSSILTEIQVSTLNAWYFTCSNFKTLVI